MQKIRDKRRDKRERGDKRRDQRERGDRRRDKRERGDRRLRMETADGALLDNVTVF